MENTRRKFLPLLQHPCHDHPLKLLYLSTVSNSTRLCDLCLRKISTAEAYACHEKCDDNYYCHKLCAEAPPRIDRHPLHPAHPLLLIHDRSAFQCNCCSEKLFFSRSAFSCEDCNFYLDIACALSTISDEGGYQCGKTSEQITIPLHPHQLTSFFKRHDFVGDSDCYICNGFVEEDGYMCLRQGCEFIIHKDCIHDLYYEDGTKAPRVYHGHPLETFVEEDTGPRTCLRCGSDKSGEFIGCERCQVFYHKDCFQVPEILRYPSHNQDHTLVLFPDTPTMRRCESCSMFLGYEICYSCSSCEFSVHVGCALQVLAYCEEGMSAKIELSWHKHPLFLYHLTESASNGCFYCGAELIGQTYVCEEKDCEFQLHGRCMEIEPTITHPHHPDHPLTLCEKDYDTHVSSCKACGVTTRGLMFSCDRCLVDIDVNCAAHFPTHKHYLHEHELQRFEKHRYMECNRCGATNGSPLFRCVPCEFNLHEECMELPQVMRNDKIHWHPLTLHEIFLEDDTGEYYCEHCEKTRDPRLGVYVCGYCKISLPRIYHIHCVLPELGNVNPKKREPSVVEKLNERIADKKEEVRTIKEKLDEATRDLDELVKQRTEILDEEMDHDISNALNLLAKGS